MPSKTFYNLPFEKQQRLIGAAMQEFTRVPVAEASINRIVQTAEIARGSFYQYFEDKNDLFFYCIQGFLGDLEQQTLTSLDRHQGDVFSVAEDILAFFIEFGSQINPQLMEHMMMHLNIFADKRMCMMQLWYDYKKNRGPVIEKIDLPSLNLQREEDLDYIFDILLNELKWNIGKAYLLQMTSAQVKTEFKQKLDLLRRGLARPTEEQA